MFRSRFVCLILAVACLLAAGVGVSAVTVDSDTAYCFSPEDFSQGEEPLTGICITGLPEADAGTVLLGSRVLRPGDILTAGQVAQMTFAPVRTQTDAQAVVTYLPIYENRVEKSATMTISIRGKEDKAPVAEDLALETYKNLPLEGILKAHDPEGETLTFSVIRKPKRGEVVINADGSFTYTPKKNKVGTDSFTFTAADPAGNVSREATVTIQILKPTDSRQYTDTLGQDCRFAAEWMRNTGLFVGETINGQSCFQPEKTVSRGEFLSMMVKTLNIPLEEDVDYTTVTAGAPDWMKPYLAAALRSGLVSGWPTRESGAFDMSDAITGAEAAVAIQNALELNGEASRTEAANTDEIKVVQTDVTTDVPAAEDPDTIPAWAERALAVMEQYGMTLVPNEPLTRADAALVLYRMTQLAPEAPGMAVFQGQ